MINTALTFSELNKKDLQTNTAPDKKLGEIVARSEK